MNTRAASPCGATECRDWTGACPVSRTPAATPRSIGRSPEGARTLQRHSAAGGSDCDSEDCTQDSASSCTSCQELDMEQDSSEDQSSFNHTLYIPNNYMTKSMLCLNEESQHEVRQCLLVLRPRGQIVSALLSCDVIQWCRN